MQVQALSLVVALAWSEVVAVLLGAEHQAAGVVAWRLTQSWRGCGVCCLEYALLL